ncbi:hypothetical protein HK098_005251 [Nowakowskiella sp. JEL0407]|nr:hypothetical protein HK098_005251 [Nowakowskiella sp. JEL0407]
MKAFKLNYSLVAFFVSIGTVFAQTVVTIGQPCDPYPAGRSCASGLICQYPAGGPPGSSGVCIAQSISPSPTASTVGQGKSCDVTTPPTPTLKLVCDVGLACAAVACGTPGKGICIQSSRPTSTTDPLITTTLNSPTITTSPTLTTVTNGIGGNCGGLVYPRPVCSPGLKCTNNPSPTVMDLPGTCVDPTTTIIWTTSPSRSSTTSPRITNGIGGNCGGLLYPPPVCSPGLKCTYNPSPTVMDLPGTCVDPTTTIIWTTSPSPTSRRSPSPSPTACVQKWWQCGGIYYTGAVNCCAGSICQTINQWYSQCL